jgi:hypothetical protein
MVVISYCIVPEFGDGASQTVMSVNRHQQHVHIKATIQTQIPFYSTPNPCIPRIGHCGDRPIYYSTNAALR